MLTASNIPRDVVGGIEVIDSRYEAFSFTGPDVVADNNSAAKVAIGDVGIGPRDTDLTTLGCVFEVDHEVVGTAVPGAGFEPALHVSGRGV